MPLPSTPLHVVVAGGGVAAVELALALHELADDRVRLTMISPQVDFELRALSTAEPFSVDHVRRHPLRDLAKRAGAQLLTDSVSAVDPKRHAVRLASGPSVPYDALVLAVGARHRAAYTRAMTFTGDTSTLPFNGLLADLEEHWSDSVAFVVPPGTTWTLPLYELALMTARDVRGMGIDDAQLELVSPEAAPLALFGAQASLAVADLLDRAGIAFRGESYVYSNGDGALELLPGGERIDAERVVALPIIAGPQLTGVPADGWGFIPIDEHGHVRGLTDVYAAGDGTTFPVKQGGLACQLADAIAEQLAAAAGADVEPQPFRPILRGRLLTGRGAEYLEQPLRGGSGAGPTPELRLWSAARKIDGRYLSPWLEELEGHEPAPSNAGESHVDVEVELPTSYETGRDALRLDPLSPMSVR
jgi:sulfide:quinone oxidoreductase